LQSKAVWLWTSSNPINLKNCKSYSNTIIMKWCITLNESELSFNDLDRIMLSTLEGLHFLTLIYFYNKHIDGFKIFTMQGCYGRNYFYGIILAKFR
jgi:hypothetical protein